MAVKIRLSRFGKKNYSYFHIVVTDVRSPRDSREIEQIGTYNPNTNPATIVIKADEALLWLNKGAVPTNTARRILSYEGIMLRKHLQGGVAKGAFTQEEADNRWNAWKAERDNKVSDKVNNLRNSAKDSKNAAIAAESKVNEARGIVFPHLVAAGITQLIAAGNIRIDERHLTGAERGRRLLLLRHRCQRDLF